MRIRPLIAAALAVAALPAFAAPAGAATTATTARHVLATHEENGATAGRSPHKAYRPRVAAPAACGTPMHSQPGGKLPVFGVRQSAACDTVEAQPAALAAAE
ncbi:hypothetical protein [Sphingomonas morindae]|uniref:Uncharacterized protein n=1 Tax=Sphingomonas morindae TaxID=1541170 RepID=A0ABY4X972_9SPHN|nr:hypothetical protein [Sphingomonas morindae]USI73251.1 hypothetical protein LHA26_01870 [Sphingomonas morindae]